MRAICLVVLVTACSNAADPTPDAPVGVVDAPMVDAPTVDAPPPLSILVVNEIAPGETPDWFEIVNVSGVVVQLEQFSYVDIAGDFAKAKPFPAVSLAPGAYHVQDVDDVVSGFKLGSDEELWVYRIADQRLSDGVDWAEGVAPAGSSYARSPDRTGAFITDASPTKNAANN